MEIQGVTRLGSNNIDILKKKNLGALAGATEAHSIVGEDRKKNNPTPALNATPLKRSVEGGLA